MSESKGRESLFPSSAFSDDADRELVWETLRAHPDFTLAESALQALDRIFDRYDAVCQNTPHREAPMRLDGDAEPPAGIPADGEEGAIGQQGARREGDGSTEQEPSQSVACEAGDAHTWSALWSHFGPYGDQDAHYHVCLTVDDHPAPGCRADHCGAKLVGAVRDCVDGAKHTIRGSERRLRHG